MYLDYLTQTALDARFTFIDFEDAEIVIRYPGKFRYSNVMRLEVRFDCEHMTHFLILTSFHTFVIIIFKRAGQSPGYLLLSPSCWHWLGFDVSNFKLIACNFYTQLGTP